MLKKEIYINGVIKVETTGRDYDFIATIKNLTGEPVALEIIGETITLAPFEWLGVLADEEGRAILESIKANDYTVEEHTDPTERAMRYAVDLLEYFEFHNKNLTKEQYHRITEALDAIKGALK